MSSQVDLAVSLYRENLSLAEVGRRMGVSHVTVVRLLEQANEPRRRRGPLKKKITERDHRAVELYRQNLSLAEVGARMGGISRQRVLQILKKMGEPRRKAGGRRAVWSADLEAQALALHQEGLSVERIVRELRCSEGCLVRVLRERGLMRKAGTPSAFTPEIRATAVAEYLADPENTTVLLGKKYGTYPSVIGRWIKAAGHELRHGSQSFGYTDELKAEVVSRNIDLGETQSEIAERFGLTTPTVSRWVQAAIRKARAAKAKKAS